MKHSIVLLLLLSKLLPTPERVPFRLTRNVIDGLGPLGIEGMFSKVAEATLSALKENTNSLLTILSAITSDPAYKWIMSTGKREKQGRSNGTDTREKNEIESPEAKIFSAAASELLRGDDAHDMAAYAIKRIHGKLQGYEDGTSGEQLSVESQVQLLLNAAKDPDNLCCIFPGWAPWS
jgi:ataxia telangiectasia mutated family protein